MKTLRGLLTFGVVLAVATVAQAAPLVLQQDNFDDNSIDGAKWNVVTSGIPQNPKSVTETGGRIHLEGRAHFNTAQSFAPASPAVGGLKITGTWEFGTTPADEFLQILTRSDGTPGGGYGETNNGIEMLAFTNNNNLQIRGLGGAVVTGGGAVNLPGGIPNGSTFDFVLTDDGTNVSATMTQVGIPGNTVTVNATSSYAPAKNLVVFHNRETGRDSYLDDVVIESLTLQGGPAPAAGWSVTDYFAKSGVITQHTNHNQYRDLIADVPIDLGSGPESPIDHTAGPISSPVVNFADPQGGGGTTWGNQIPFPGDTSANDGKFATRAEGFVVIPTAGDWSFAVGTDDTYELIIDGTVIGTRGCCGSPQPIVTANLPAGTLPISVEFGEDGGGAYFWLAAAQGTNVPFNTTAYRLVGDMYNGGLQVLSAPPAVVPEPMTMLAIGLGISGLGGYVRKRRRA